MKMTLTDCQEALSTTQMNTYRAGALLLVHEIVFLLSVTGSFEPWIHVAERARDSLDFLLRRVLEAPHSEP